MKSPTLMTERTGTAFLIISSLLIPLFFAVRLLAPLSRSIIDDGGVAFLEITISLFVFAAFPLSIYLLRHAKKTKWMKIALGVNGLFFALELVACFFAFSAYQQGLID